jgi:hypothetical protein
MKRAMPNVRTPNGKPLKQAAEKIMKGEVTSLNKEEGKLNRDAIS